MATTISVINMKGGVGKTTIAVQLAWHLAANGYPHVKRRILLVDLDPQFNASQYVLTVPKYINDVVRKKHPTVWNIFEEGSRTPIGKVPAVKPERVILNVAKFDNDSRVDLIPSCLDLSQTLRHPRDKSHRLDEFVQKIRRLYDFIIIDCAPTDSVLTTAAYRASDHLLVPVVPEYLASIGLPLIGRSLEDYYEESGRGFPGPLGVVINETTKYKPEEPLAHSEIALQAKRLGWYVFNEQIRYSKSFVTSARSGKPLFWTHRARWWVKGNFAKFTSELIERLERLSDEEGA